MKELNLYNSYKYIIARCPLFNDVRTELLPDALKYLRAQYRTYQKDDLLLTLGEPPRYGVLLLSGSLEGSFINESFNKINLNHFAEGALICESFACAQLPQSPIQLRAMTDSDVLLLDLTVLYDDDAIRHSYQLKISINLIRELALQNVFLSSKIRILSQKTLREKVLVYFRSLPKRPDGSFKIPFNKTALAEYMGVNRSALSRELSRMITEGLLEPLPDAYRLL